MRQLTLLFWLLCAAAGAFAQARGEAGGPTLLGLTVTGNSTTDEQLIRINSGLRVGSALRGEDVQQAIRQLWSLKRFSSVEVLLARELSEGIYLEIQVEELPRLRSLEIVGNDKLGKTRLRDALKGVVTVGLPVGELEMFKARRTLQDLYEKEGFRLAEVEVAVRNIEEGQGDLHVVVKEGQRIRIDQVIIQGNEQVSDAKLIRRMKKTRPRMIFRSGKFDREAFEVDKGLLVAYLHNLGYRDARVLSDSVWVDEQSRDLKVLVHLYEGRLYEVGEISWAGNTVFTVEELQRQISLRPGDPYSRKKLEQSVQEGLHDLYYNRGYIQAQVRPVELPRDEAVIDIRFEITENNVFSVKRVDFAGNDKTKEKVLRREMHLRPGDTFDVGKLRRSLRDLTILNYFEAVNPDVDIASADQVNLTVEVKEKNTDQIMMSAGYSERDKLVGSIGFSLNNLMGNGQTLSFDWQFARSYRSLNLEFQEPFLFDRPILAGFRVFDIQRTRTYNWDFDQKSRGGSVTLGKRLTWPDNYFRVSSTYRLEETVYTNFVSSSRAELNRRGIYEDDPELASTLSVSLVRDSRDHPEFPQNGSTVRLDSEIGGGYLGGERDFQRYTLEARSYSPFLGKFIHYNSLEAGIVDGLGARDEVPWIKRFFMGGSGLSLGTPLRGYSDRSVGTGEDGGRIKFKAGTEIRFQLIPNPTVYGLVFGEAGKVWKNLKSSSLSDLDKSAGLGLRLHMPMIGLIGLDYAYGFDRVSSSTGLRQGKWEFHFQFGREF
ncbi:MAG: outer membrane protein assembly factor BamA [bacterium]|jgi:outer membrane protein insertion porin family|nr:outer membrane protein assembly factor BamA [bacterium]